MPTSWSWRSTTARSPAWRANGTHYFYQNPLESDGSHTRWDWHPCPCCTMNVSRLVASIGGYFYSTGADVARRASLRRQHRQRSASAERRCAIRQETDYPWSGAVRIDGRPGGADGLRAEAPHPGLGAQAPRSPVNGEPVDAAKRDRGYVEIRREWSAGDTVDLDLPMPVERIYANPKVKMDVGRVALKRGPLVYCLEQVDNPDAPVGLLRLPREAKAEGRRARRPLRRDRHHRRRRRGGRRGRMGRRSLPQRAAPSTHRPS